MDPYQPPPYQQPYPAPPGVPMDQHYNAAPSQVGYAPQATNGQPPPQQQGTVPMKHPRSSSIKHFITMLLVCVNTLKKGLSIKNKLKLILKRGQLCLYCKVSYNTINMCILVLFVWC